MWNQTKLTKQLSVAILMVSMMIVPVGQSAPPSPAQCDSDLANGGSVLAPPGAAEITNWTPGCINLDNGASVEFRNLDAVAHRVKAGTCLDSGNINIGNAKAFTFEYDDYLELVSVTDGNGDVIDCDPEDPLNQQQREGRVPFGSTGAAMPVVELLDDEVVIHFICVVHGAAMKGEIHLPR